MLNRFKEMFRWAEDDGGIGGGSSGDLSFEDETPSRGFVLDVVEDPEAEPAELKGKDRAALLAEMKAKEDAFQKQLADAQAAASQTAALQGAFAGLADRLEKVAARSQAPQAPQVPMRPQETPEQFKERIRTTLLEDPVQAIAEAGERLYGPLLQQQASAIASLSKRLLVAEPENKLIYEKYGAEIDALAATAPGNPQAFLEATEIVKSRHLGDLIELRAQEIAAAKLAAMQPQGQQSGQKPTTHVETSPRAAPRVDARGRAVVPITRSKMAEVKAFADANHMSPEQAYELYFDTSWQNEAI